MKILIFGKGYIGGRMTETWGAEALLSDVRIDDKAAVLKAIDEYKPDAVVNTAGKTGRPNVDWCETHQAETAQGNTVAPLILAEACQERGVYLLHIGSGCIFYGPSPDPRGWREDDFANPESFYSRTKYAADLLLSKLPNVAIARLRMPIDDRPNPRNLIDKLAGYKQIIDVENSVTIIEDLISVCYQLIQKRGTGIFHVTNPGVMRHRHLIDLYRQYVNPNFQCEWIANEELISRGLATATRSNCFLQSRRLQELGIFMRPIEEALRATMVNYAANSLASRITHLATDMPQPPIPPAPPESSLNPKPFNFLRDQRPREMKGVILAGGKGTRLAPLTNTTNKHLLPVFNKQMVLYPLQTLLDAGIRDIILVTAPDYAGHFVNLLGSGASRGCHITYRIQDEAGGIAHALAMTERFVNSDNCTVILGDNIFDESFAEQISSFQSGAAVFYKPVQDPTGLGVVEVDSSGNVVSIEEKPKIPKSNFAQLGLYMYDPSVFDVIRTLKPSGRGELEITDVNNHYLRNRQLAAKPVQGFWADAGTFTGLKEATEYFAQKEGL